MSRKKEAKILSQLGSLTANEAKLLVAALEKNAQTIYWQNGAAEVVSLAAKGLLETVADESQLQYKPFSIPHFVWDHMKTLEVSRTLRSKADT